MTMDDLIARCKASVTLTANEHRSFYQTVDEYVISGWRGVERDEIEPDVLQGMIETDTVIELQFYPNTPVGCYVIWHWSIEAALAEAELCLQESGV